MPKYRFQTKPKSKLFDYLKKYRFILVSGPHRAGTTIAAAMIANDLGYGFEEDWQNQLESFPELSGILSPMVIHCPSYCHYIHHLTDVPGLAVVMVIRDTDDIIASEKRIPWAFEPQQLSLYRSKATPKPSFAIQSPISVVKYRYWHEVQKPLFGPNGYEILYEDLKNHSMWIAPGQRDGFTANQIEIGRPHGPKVQGRRFPVGVAGNVIDNEVE